MAKICFVIMPIGSPSADRNRYELFKEIYEDVIRPAIHESDPLLSCIRADEIRQTGNIVRDIVSHLCEAELVVADLTDQNPNVFYELGVRHALGRSTLLLAQTLDSIPFDLQSYRTLVYGLSPRAISKFKAELATTVKSILKSTGKPDGPVADFLSASNIRVILETFEKAQELPVGSRDSTIKSIASKLEQLQQGQESLAGAIQKLTEERSDLLEDLRRLKDIRQSWRQKALTSDVAVSTVFGGWFGVSGRMLLAAGDDRRSVKGDYDWKGFPLVGHISGKLEGRILKFQWRWDKSPEHGNGFFVCDEGFTHLEGGWFADEDGVDLDEATEGSDAANDLIHPWSFSRQLNIDITK